MLHVAPPNIRLRPTLPGDIATMFQFQLDPASNQLAGTKPRDLAAFTARWEQNLRNPDITARVIITTSRTTDGATRYEDAGETLVGSIDKFRQEETDSIGYWIAREHWGRGIATRAIALLLAEVGVRPLFARVAAHNPASIRALERNGFVIDSRCHVPACERFIGGERLMLKLA